MTNKAESQDESPLSEHLIGETLAEYRSRLAAYTEQPLLEALLILSHATSLPKTWVLAHPESVLTASQAQAAENLIQKRSEGHPLPYLIGRWEFYGREFKISPQVLIPRPETEILVETALEWLRIHPKCRKALDIGTGSGCIAVTLAVNVSRLLVTAGDISHEAIMLARDNATFHGTEERVSYYLGDLSLPLRGKFDLICANLPYIPSEELDGLDVARQEPTLALNGGLDGMEQIRRLLEDAPRITAPGGLVLLEIEAGQGKAALAAGRKAFPRAEITVVPDLAGNDRVLRVQLD